MHFGYSGTWVFGVTNDLFEMQDPTVAMSISMAMAFEEQKDRLDRHLRSKIDDERFSMYKEDMKYIHKLWQVQILLLPRFPVGHPNANATPVQPE